MKRVLAVILTLVMVGMFMAAAVVPTTGADIPRTLNYQGYLTDISGDSVTGPVSIVFRINNVDSEGSALWRAAV